MDLNLGIISDVEKKLKKKTTYRLLIFKSKTPQFLDLNLGIISDVEKKLKKKLLIDYLYSNLRHHNLWAYKYFFCEFLALLGVSGQMFLLDRFFDGTFFTYGIEVMSFAERDQEDRIDPMIYLFPRMTNAPSTSS